MPDVVYRVSASGVEQARRSLDELNSRTDDWKVSADRLAGSFQGVARDIDTVAGESASQFARAANDVLGVATALGTGGFAGAAAIASAAVSGLIVVYNQWNKETEEQERLAKAAAGADKKWLDDTIALVKEATDNLKRKSTEQLRGIAIVKDLQEVQVAQERMALAQALSATKADSEERKKIRADLAANTTKMGETVAAREKAWADYRVSAERDGRKDINEGEMDLQKRREERAKKRQEMADAVADANSDANIKDSEDAKKKAAEADRIQEEKNKRGQEALDKRARAFEKEKEEKAKAAAQEDKDGQEALDQLNRLLDASDALVQKKKELAEESRKVAIAESLQTGSTIALAGASTVATPIIGALTDAEMELAMANRDTFRDMTIFSHELPALIAQKTQAILAGIAVEATGRAIMEGGEAAAALGLGLGLAALGLPNAGAAFASAAAHGAAAAMFANIAGISLAGAGIVGASRGDGGLVGLTSAEKKANDKGLNSSTRGSDGGLSRGGGFGGNGVSDGSPAQQNTYFIYNNSVDASDKPQRNRQIQAANRDNARDPFAAREMRRAV